MNTEAIRIKFEAVSPPQKVFIFSDGDYYLDEMIVNPNTIQDFLTYRGMWRGYMQAVKDMETENENLRMFPDFKVPSECIARFIGQNDLIEALDKAALVASGFNECRDWFKANRGEL